MFENAKKEGKNNFYLTYISIGDSGGVNSLDCLEPLKDLDIRQFEIRTVFGRYSINDSTGLKYLTKVTKIELNYMNFDVLKGVNPVYDETTGELISGCPLLSTFYIHAGRYLTDISVLSECSNLTAITVVNSSVSKIYGLDKLNKLTTLNLQNNSLMNTADYTNGSITINYDPLDICVTLRGKNLRYLYLKGNNFDSVEKIKALTWSAINY